MKTSGKCKDCGANTKGKNKRCEPCKKKHSAEYQKGLYSNKNSGKTTAGPKKRKNARPPRETPEEADARVRKKHGAEVETPITEEEIKTISGKADIHEKMKFVKLDLTGATPGGFTITLNANINTFPDLCKFVRILEQCAEIVGDENISAFPIIGRKKDEDDERR